MIRHAIDPATVDFGLLSRLAEEYGSLSAEFTRRMEAHPALGPDECCPEIIGAMDAIEALVLDAPGFRRLMDALDVRFDPMPVLSGLLAEARWRVARRLSRSFDEIDRMRLSATADTLGLPSRDYLLRIGGTCPN